MTLLKEAAVEYLFELGLFAGKAFLIVAAIVVILVFFAMLVYRMKTHHHLEVEVLNEKYQDLSNLIKLSIFNKEELKNEKKLSKKIKKNIYLKPRAFVLDFEGDISASSVASLREEVTSILKIA